MQMSFASKDELSRVLSEMRTLGVIDEIHSGLRTYVLDGAGYQDCLAVVGQGEGALMLHPCSADGDSGGSIHDHARAALAEETT